MDWIPVVQRICSLFVVGFVVFTYYCILKQDKAAKQKKRSENIVFYSKTRTLKQTRCRKNPSLFAGTASASSAKNALETQPYAVPAEVMLSSTLVSIND